MTRVFCRRWLDDVLLLLSRSASPALCRAVRQYLQPYFFGPRLELKLSGGSTAFGFRLLHRNGVIVARPLLKDSPGQTVATVASSPPLSTSSDTVPAIAAAVHRGAIHGGQKFRAPGVEFAVTVGQVFRVLDSSSDSHDATLAILVRLLGSMLLAGFDRKTLLRGLRRAKLSAWCNLTIVDQALMKDPVWLERWVSLYDAHDELAYLRSLHELALHTHT